LPGVGTVHASYPLSFSINKLQVATTLPNAGTYCLYVHILYEKHTFHFKVQSHSYFHISPQIY